MRELTSVVLEMDKQGKRLHGLLRVGRLNTLRRSDFVDLVAIIDKLMVNLTDFNVLHFGSDPVYKSRARKPPGSANYVQRPQRKTAKRPRVGAVRSWLRG